VRQVTILGSTGSIGTQAIDVALAAPERFRIAAICAGGRDVTALAEQAARLRVDVVGVTRTESEAELRKALEISDEAERATAFRTLLAEETRMGMLIGVAVGWALAQELNG
jgi:1-deoxy-D-xylulose-5-phosphate reductoisomerase